MEQVKKILIVDDDEDIVHHSSTYLRRRGYNVSTASSGKEALEAAKMIKPDLVMLDFVLPDICGDDVAAGLAEEDSLKATKVLFISGQVVGDDDEEVKVSAGKYVLKKPCNPEAMLKIVVELIGGAK